MTEPSTVDSAEPSADFQPAPGTTEPGGRFRLRYELIGCGLTGHTLIGTDAARIRAEDAWVVRP